jgi:hypothetical protein
MLSKNSPQRKHDFHELNARETFNKRFGVNVLEKLFWLQFKMDSEWGKNKYPRIINEKKQRIVRRILRRRRLGGLPGHCRGWFPQV